MIRVSTSSRDWVSAYASELRLDAPSESERELILALAAIAAHASE